jgi:hypothetical protein
MSQAGEIDVIGSHPEIPTEFIADSGTAVPIANQLELLGEVVLAGGIPFRSVASGNTVTYQVQYANETAVTNAAIVGLASFNSASFDVDANGFVNLLGGGVAATNIDVDASTAPGTDPVVPNGSGNIIFTGAQVATGTVGANVIRTNSLAANSVTIQIQRSTAVAAADSTKNGVSHFDSASFAVAATGFVTLNSSALGKTITGNTGGARSPTLGNWNLVTSNSTAVIAGASSTLTLDFGLANLILGSSGTSITTADSNVGFGKDSLLGISSGLRNTAIGFNSLKAVTSGTDNVAVGYNALAANSLNLTSTAVGVSALQSATADANTAVGYRALLTNVSGESNVAVGSSAIATIEGSFNTSIGKDAGIFITTGDNNTFVGSRTAATATSSSNNTYLGYRAGSLILTGSSNLFLGYQSGIAYTGTESSNISIGNSGVLGESNKLRIGTQGTGTQQQDESYIAGQLNGLSGRSFKITAPGAYPYTALKTDYVIIVDTSVARTINLIAAKVNNPVYVIKDNVGSAATNNITVSGNGSNIDGAASYTMNVNYQSIMIVWNGTQWNVI